MPKEKSDTSLKGVSLKGHSYLNTYTGFYLQGFTTKIKHANYIIASKAKLLGLDLVSRYTKVNQKLLDLKLIKEDSTLSTHTDIYQVRTGNIIYGKLYIMYQRFNEDDTNITYNYRYRVSSKEFFNANTKTDSRIRTGRNQELEHLHSLDKNVGSDDTRFKNHKYVRIRNKQEKLRRKYKER